MNRTIVIAVVSALITGCGAEERPELLKDDAGMAETMSITGFGDVVHSRFIDVDTANKMLGSYLQSINYAENDSSLRSIIFDADSIRQYLNNGQIKYVKIMLAHSLRFINSGREGEPAGYNSDALTFVVAGFDSSGNYVLTEANQVLEHGMPCPTNCVSTGSASSDLLPNN